ncbi:cation/h(+) antiporter 19 [Quercus suber]|uniref:Cation/h(+) antiporter 19 n=1 Tax=Quercus suber TaxID=58331 RepID=A0AAW0J627_QUESU
MTVLDTVANIGLLFFLFLVGLELDMRSIRHTGRKALGIALAGISLPFALGIGTSFVLRSTISEGVSKAPFLVFMGVAMSITAFPVLARILAELKLLTTDIGRIAMSAAAVNDVAAWVLLALAIAISGSDDSPVIALWVLLCGVAFLIVAFFVLRPGLALMARRSLEGEPVKEIHICITLSLVLAASFVTDTIGIHALFGAFVVGILVPKEGPFAGILIEKIEDLVSGLFLPLYFVSSGLKTNVATISGATSWGLLVLVICTACIGKILGTFIVSRLCKVPIRESLALAFLMNTKGLVELIVLNIGKDRKVLNDQTFAIMVLMALFTTFITTPIVTAVYKPARKAAPYKHRTVKRKDIDSEFRILACFHSTRNIPTIINLIESSRGTRRQKLCVYAIHLMELSERSSAISMIHKARSNGLPFWNKKHENKDQMVIAFEAYRQLSSVIVRPMTAISALSNIHEDICTSAAQKRVAIILIPFHKHQRLDGAMESLGHSFHLVNKRVLHHAPCSHPGILLNVIRFVPSPGKSLKFDKSVIEDNVDHEEDELMLSEFKSTHSDKEKESNLYEEMLVENKAEVVDALKALNKYNLFLVGRMVPTVPLVNKTDCPELGPVGSFLASSEFSTTASVLVVQQYNPSANLHPLVEEQAYYGETSSMPDSPHGVPPV